MDSELAAVVVEMWVEGLEYSAVVIDIDLGRFAAVAVEGRRSFAEQPLLQSTPQSEPRRYWGLVIVGLGHESHDIGLADLVPDSKILAEETLTVSLGRLSRSEQTNCHRWQSLARSSSADVVVDP